MLRQKTAKTREKRLQTLSAYLGEVHPLLQDLGQDDVSQRIRTFSQSSYDEIIYILRLLNKIEDAVTVIHAPRGCGAAQLYLNAAKLNRSRWAVTNLDERDTILGADTKLRETVHALYRRYRPSLVFIVATPAVAINNDDIQSVADELGEELGIKVVPVYSDGFKSKSALTGYDVALHALLKYLVVKKPEGRGRYLNLISVAEKGEDLAEVQGLLHELGLRVNVLPDTAALDNFAEAAQARFSIGIDPDSSDYLGKALASEHGVPFVQPSLPIGIEGTHRWLSALGKAAGVTAAVDDLHGLEKGELKALIKKAKLKNVRVYISLPASAALGVADLVEELGGEVAGISVDQVDSSHARQFAERLAQKPDLQLHVAQGQPFEEANILQRVKPDLYVGGFGQPVLAAKLGIPAVSVHRVGLLGYGGVRRFARLVSKALRNNSFVARLAAGAGLPYHDAWQKKSPNWYIKQEVK